MRRRLLGAVLGLLGAAGLRADDIPPAPVTDAAVIRQHYQQMLAQPQFQETDRVPLDSRVEDWLSQWFKRLGTEFGEFKYANRMPAFESLLMTLLVVMSITALLYVMARLTRRRGRMEPEPTGAMSAAEIPRPPEFYDDEIARARQAGDWHAAWLAAWRQFLSRLEQRHLVEPDRTRTNREYLAQLREKALPSSALGLLTAMVDAYDRFIYGKKAIGQPEWDVFHRQIGEAVLLLHLEGLEPAAGPETP